MTRQERLLEQYEDACFALLMEDVLVREGERLEALNRRLLADPAAAVPESLDRRCRAVMDRACFAGKRRAALRRTGRALRSAAIAAAVAAALFTSAFAVSEGFREAALNLVRTVTGTYTQLDIQRPAGDGGQSSARYFPNLEIGWVPEGFSYHGGEFGECAVFENEEEASFRVSVYPGNDYVDIDTLTPDRMDNISAGGWEGFYVVKDGKTDLLVQATNLYGSIRVQASAGVPLETAEKIMENIRPLHGGPNGTGYFGDVELRWLPEGFVYTEGAYDWFAKFKGPSGGWLWVYLYDGDGSLKIDTADAHRVEEISINGNQGLRVVREGSTQIVLTDLEHNLYIDVSASSTLSAGTLNKVMENITVLPQAE